MAINVKDKLVTLESLGVAYSAEQDAREEADQALSTRIDNIVAPEGDPSLTEVSDARVSGSTTHNTLKARLDADKTAIETEISQLSADLETLVGGGDGTEALTFTTGKYINTGGSGVNIGDTIDVSNPSTYATLKYAIAECSEGDRFLLNVKGAASGRAWAFLTSSNVLISRADASVTLTNFYITAPANAGKIVIDDNFEQGTTGGMAYKVIAGAGKGVVVRFDTAQDLTDAEKAQARENIGVSSSGMTDAIKEALLACFEHVAWVDEYGQDYYDALELALYGGTPPEIHEYIYPDDDKTIVIANKQLEGGYASDNGAYISNNNQRAVVCSNTGEHSISLSSASAQETNYYPIPIPDDATSAKIELSPSTLYCYASIVKYDSSKATGYVRALENNWAQSGVTINFTQGIGTGLVLNLKANSAGRGTVSVNSVKITYS